MDSVTLLDRSGQPYRQNNRFPVSAAETLQVSGEGCAANATPIPATDVGAYRWVCVQFTGTWSATVLWEISNDGVNWDTTVLLTASTTNGVLVASTTSNRLVHGPVPFRYFRVRISSYSSGTVSAAAWFSSNPAPPLGMGVDTELPAAAVLADATSNPTTPLVGACTHFWKSSGSVWDRARGNDDFTALASAARTATTSSSDFTNYNWRGIRCFLNVTVASGTGGLQLQVEAKDSIGSGYAAINAAPTAVTATGLKVYDIYPGITDAVAGGITQKTSSILARVCRVTVTAGDASSYTYSVSYSMLL